MGSIDFKIDYILENGRVLLQPLTKDNSAFLAPFSINEPELWQYSVTPGDGLENFKKYITQALEGRDSKNAYPFIIFDKRSQKYAGTTRFYDIQDHHVTSQLGYTWIGKEFQGSGLNKNCKFLMLEFAFEKIGWERVEFRADAKNKQSIAAMASIGCKNEGILRSNYKIQTGRRDSIVLSILKNEWAATVKNDLLERITLK